MFVQCQVLPGDTMLRALQQYTISDNGRMSFAVMEHRDFSVNVLSFTKGFLINRSKIAFYLSYLIKQNVKSVCFLIMKV